MFLILMLPPTSTLFPYTTLFRSYLMVRLRHHAPSWRTIGWRPLPPHALSGGFRYATCVTGGVGLAFANMVANTCIPTKGTPAIDKPVHDRQGAPAIRTLAILAGRPV